MAGAGGHIADGVQPGAAQAAGDGLISAEREYRQRLDRGGFPALPDDAAMEVISQGPRTDRGSGDRGADGKALPPQRVAQHLHQRRFAAEQMGAAGDVEKQAMRGVERHQRREAIAPVGDVVQQAGVGGFIGIEHP